MQSKDLLTFQSFLDGKHDGLHSEIELRIGLFIIDNVENVGEMFAAFHVGDLKVEPLVMFIRVDICIQDQVILTATHIDGFAQIAGFKAGFKLELTGIPVNKDSISENSQ